MPERSFYNILSKSFPKSNKEDWLRIASQELDGKNPLENLTWKIEGLRFYPYYDASDLKNLDYLNRHRAHQRQHTEPGGWQNLPSIKVLDEKTANAQALQFLAAGADGVLFDVTGSINFDINQLLKEIDWPSCTISFLAGRTETLASKISSYADRNHYDPLALTGSIFWKELPNNIGACVETLMSLKKFHACGITIPHSSLVHEISKALEQSVLLVDNLTNLGIAKDVAFKSVSFSVLCEGNFLISIAKLKSLRLLWHHVAEAFQIKGYNRYDLYVHAYSKKWHSENFQPHATMIKHTIDALAAVLGECDALTLEAENTNEPTMNRVALYVSNILKEESHLGNVADAVAGAYAIENIVHELAQAAWKDFQNKVST